MTFAQIFAPIWQLAVDLAENHVVYDGHRRF